MGCVCVFLNFRFSAGEAVEAESYDEASVNLRWLECDAVKSFEHHVMSSATNKTTSCGLLRHKALCGDTFISCSCQLLNFTHANLPSQGPKSLTSWPLVKFLLLKVKVCSPQHALASVTRRQT